MQDMQKNILGVWKSRKKNGNGEVVYAKKWGTCVGKVYGFNSDRICAECKKNIKDSNL